MQIHSALIINNIMPVFKNTFDFEDMEQTGPKYDLSCPQTQIQNQIVPCITSILLVLV